jgi:hypothetical protein
LALPYKRRLKTDFFWTKNKAACLFYRRLHLLLSFDESGLNCTGDRYSYLFTQQVPTFSDFFLPTTLNQSINLDLGLIPTWRQDAHPLDLPLFFIIHPLKAAIAIGDVCHF